MKQKTHIGITGDNHHQWWREPLPDWRRGILSIRNMTTDRVTILNLASGQIASKTSPAETSSIDQKWWKDNDR